MSIPWLDRMAALKAADLHVQVALENIPQDFDMPYGTLHVSGKVVRIFKSTQQLEIAAVVEFDLPVVVREKGSYPDGGMICWYEDLLLHRYLEVCLNGSPPFCSIAEDLYEIIPRPTEVPVIDFEEAVQMQREDERKQKNKKWWQFW